MKPVGGAKFHEALSASCRILATTTGFIHHPMNVKKSNFNLYLHFVLRSFLRINCGNSVLIVQNTRRRKVIKGKYD